MATFALGLAVIAFLALIVSTILLAGALGWRPLTRFTLVVGPFALSYGLYFVSLTFDVTRDLSLLGSLLLAWVFFWNVFFTSQLIRRYKLESYAPR